MVSIILLLIGALLGAIFGMILPALYKRTINAITSLRLNRRKKLLSSGHVTRWLLNYYRSNGSNADLHICKIGDTSITIPFLTQSKWQKPVLIDPRADIVVKTSSESKQEFPYKQKYIKRRLALGQNVFLGESNTFYLDCIIEDKEQLEVHVKPCVFREMASKLIELEEETFHASRFKRPTPLRDKCLRDLITATKVIERPFSVGCTTAFAIRHDNSYDLLIHTRSDSTMTFGGSKAVIPNFGLEPNFSKTGKSEFGVLFFNFIKEYLEELFDYEELIHSQSARRPSPDWFFNLPEAAKLMEMQKVSDFWLEYLGFGIDALNGTGNIALLAVVNDTSFRNTLLPSIKANWEVADGAPHSGSIFLVDYKDNQIGTWLKDGKLQYGSAFAIDLASKKLDILRERLRLGGEHGSI